MKNYYITTRFVSSEDAWPPHQPKHFTPVVLVHQETQQTKKQREERMIWVKATRKGGMKEYLSITTQETTKNLQEIFSKLDQIDQTSGSKKLRWILVEGAPGVGKSVLLKHIAYLWAKGELITSCSLLFLLYLRDPAVQKIESLHSLVHHVYPYDKDGPEISSCKEHLKQDEGRSLIILVDGYDEFPLSLRKDSFIAKLLKREVLPNCSLVVSSRPHASTDLRKYFPCRVEILGFSEEDQQHFIEHSFEDDDKKVQELKKYLQDHPTIGNLCYIPFNMTMLLLLFSNKEEKPLPTTSTGLYSLFICLTICRHLAKSEIILDEEIDDLSQLPAPYSEIIKHLSKLAFKTLSENQLVFNLAEIKKECPDIKKHLNGYGLLQAVEYFGMTNKNISFNFIHFSVQEFLAAWHVCKLPQDEERSILESHFWNDVFLNMFAFYIALTKGQRPSFKSFLSRDGKQPIDEFFLSDPLRCLKLYHCFYEAGDTVMCQAIEKSKLNRKVIDFRDTRLSPSDMECLTLFLGTSSCKDWERLDLNRSFIQDQGVHIMHRGLMKSAVTISELWLHCNALTALSAAAISDVVIKCKVKVLGLNDNDTIGEDEKLYHMLSDPNSSLEELHMDRIKLSSNGVVMLIAALHKQQRLQILSIAGNKTKDNIITAMKNTSLIIFYEPAD